MTIEEANTELTAMVVGEPTFSWCGISVTGSPAGLEVVFTDQATCDKYQQQIGDEFHGFEVVWRVGNRFMPF